jgi:signal transduction histidine kinase
LRTWPILVLGIGTIVLLTILSALDSWRRADQIYEMALAIHEAHSQTQEALREIESGIYVSGVFVRDFLLDPSQIAAGAHRRELLAIRESMEENVARLLRLSNLPERTLMDRLRHEVDAYWDSLDPVFEWTPQQKVALSTLFLRKQVLPRRTAVLEMAGEVNELAGADLAQRQREVSARLAAHQRSGERRLAIVLLVAIVVATGSVWRISVLENRAERQRLRTEQAEAEMRQLSRKLVNAQEEERRSLSRELHDEVGQMLTALRVQLGRLAKWRPASDEEYAGHVEDMKELIGQTLNSVRRLASGLRPSVLDDLGVGAALQWQAREFSRRTGLPVEVVIEGLPANLPERHRTCIYRVVQEALTNCARHAAASNIRIVLHTESDRLALTIHDDGRGMPEPTSGNGKPLTGGLGLIGMEERVHELGGQLTIQSQPGKGTLLKVSIPIPAEMAA